MTATYTDVVPNVELTTGELGNEFAVRTRGISNILIMREIGRCAQNDILGASGAWNIITLVWASRREEAF